MNDNEVNEEQDTPPHMWIGFWSSGGGSGGGLLFGPRMGLINGMELQVEPSDTADFVTSNEAKKAARESAWRFYHRWKREAPEKTIAKFTRDLYFASKSE